MTSISKLYNNLSWDTRHYLEMTGVGIAFPAACFAIALVIGTVANWATGYSPAPSQVEQIQNPEFRP